MSHREATHDDRTLRRRAWAAAIFLGLVSTSAAMLALRSIGRRPSLGDLMVVELPYWLLWAALAPVVIRAVRLVPLRGNRPWARVMFHLCLAIALIATHTLSLYLLQTALGMSIGATFSTGVTVVARWRLASNLLAYGAIVGMIVAHDATAAARERQHAASRLAADLTRAQLDALRLQLNPHFLFNALNAAAMLIRQERGGESIRMLAGLSDLLRRVLAHGAPEVTLREELAVLDRYLAIEQVRFGDRLRVASDVDEEILDAAIPSFILQPLVENAIQHGIAPTSRPGSVTVVARRQVEQLVVEVCNDGLASDEMELAERGLGIGVRNTIERLSRLYGGAFGFELGHTDRGTVATVTLPFRLQRTIG